MNDRSQTPLVVDRDATRPVRTRLRCLDPEERPTLTTRIPPDAASETYAMRQLQAAIATRVERGDTLDTIERELIAPSGLPEEHQSALWLYAWSHPTRRAAAVPRFPVGLALENALLTLIGIYRFEPAPRAGLANGRAITRAAQEPLSQNPSHLRQSCLA